MILALDNKNERPLVLLDEIFEGCTALIDTGALIPVWTKSGEAFQTLFSDAKLIKKHIEFSGFGDKAVGDLYKFDFQLGDFIYPQMPLIVCENNKIPGFFLFSATMFSQMDISIKNSTKEFVADNFTNQKCFNIVIGDNVLSM